VQFIGVHGLKRSGKVAELHSKIIIYIDMDDTLCNYNDAFSKARQQNPDTHYPQSTPGFFLQLRPLPAAIDTFRWLCDQPQFDVYILTAPSPKNPHSYTEKRIWVEEHLGYEAVEKLIISPHKHLSKGAYLIDDRDKGKGQDKFEGRLLQFGTEQFQSWKLVREYFERLLQQDLDYIPKKNVLSDVLCFRSFDMRDRFPEPVATYREALELLQSERAYMPEYSADIVCYLRNGETIPIPEEFYLTEKARFDSREDAEKWVRDRAEKIKDRPHPAMGLLIADPSLPINEQIDEAFSHRNILVVDSSENERICTEVNNWLIAAINALPKAALEEANGEGKAQSPLSIDLRDKPPMSSSEIDDFAAMFEQACGASRWLIASDFAYSDDGDATCYLDVGNNVWKTSVNDATCFKQCNLAQTVCDTLDPALKACVKEFAVSNTALTKKSIKIDIDRQVIAHHEPTKTSLYDTHGLEGFFSPNALLHIHNPEKFCLDKDDMSGDQISVGIHLEAMDELAIAWCKHRKLQGALGGPVGKEWGSPDCDYD
jgi:5'(3')-deoxyribonucleotidase